MIKFDEIGEKTNTQWGKDEEGKGILIFESWEKRREFFHEVFLEAGGGPLEIVADPYHPRFLLTEKMHDVFGHSIRSVLGNCWEEKGPMWGTGGEICIDDILNVLNWEEGFSDEYSQCDCGKFVHTQAESYFDIGRYIWIEGEVVCRACLEDDPEEHAEWCIEGLKDGKFRPFMLDINSVSYSPITDPGTDVAHTWTSGLHDGMDDSLPGQIAYLRQVMGSDLEVLFQLMPSQFYQEWTICVGAQDLNAVTLLLQDGVAAWEEVSSGFRLVWGAFPSGGYWQLFHPDNQETIRCGHVAPGDVQDLLLKAKFPSQLPPQIMLDLQAVVASDEYLDDDILDLVIHGSWQQVPKALKDIPSLAQKARAQLEAVAISMKNPEPPCPPPQKLRKG